MIVGIKLETKYILIDEKNYKDVVICFTRYARSKLMVIVSCYYHKLTGKIEEQERKKYMMVNDYMLYKVLYKIKYRIGIEKFDDTKILIGTDDKLPDNITFKNALILMMGVTKDNGKFYPQIFQKKHQQHKRLVMTHFRSLVLLVGNKYGEGIKTFQLFQSLNS